jgi:RNA recognition motif-containing protein
MNIYVSNLGFNVQDEELKGFFTPFGEVTSAKIITDKFTGKSRGFGFVEMTNTEEAQKAIAELDNGNVEGRNIKVMEARPKESKPGGNSPFRSDNGGGDFKKRW